MKFTLVFVLAAVAVVASTVSALSLHAAEEGKVDDDLWRRFGQWQKRYNKQYKSEVEEVMRFYYYAKNLEKAEKMQKMNPHATFGETKFSDRAEHELRRTHLNAKVDVEALRKVATPTSRTFSNHSNNVTKWDWRDHGAVTPIKNQKNCGSCWSFSATGVTEGQWFLAGHNLTSLSEQELVSCVKDLVNFGCNGGAPEAAISWLQEHANGAWATEASYPYVSGEGNVPPCNTSLLGNATDAGAYVDGWEFVHNFDEKAMGSWLVEHGPIGVCLNAESWSSTYSGGIMTKCPGGVLSLDHCVLLVGFDDAHDPPYWIVKNSWGTDWGIDGYLKIEKGKDECQLAEVPYASKVTARP